MNRIAILVAVCALSLAPATSLAGEPSAPSSGGGAGGGGWLLNGATLGSGRNAFLAEFGWPGLQLSLLHGMSEKADIGGAFSFVYGLEGVPEIAPGLRLNAILRLNFVKKTSFNFGLRFSPGLELYFPKDGVQRAYFNDECGPFRDCTDVAFGLQVPVEFVAGITPINEISINLGFAMPMALFFVPEISFVLPFQFGFGVEYRVDRSFMLSFDSRFGPSIWMVPDRDPEVEFSFRTLVGVGYRF